MAATTDTRSSAVAPLRRCERRALLILAAHPDDRNGVEQRNQTDEDGDKCAVAYAYRPLPLLLQIGRPQCQFPPVRSISNRLKIRNR